MNSFEIAINRVLGNEGGYSDGQGDPGGETNWGISRRSYPYLDIKALTREQAVALYKRDFWDAAGLDRFPTSIAYQLLDFAVNSGTAPATRALQRAVGVVDDGRIGPHTIEAIGKAEPHDLIMRFLAVRLLFMTGCKNWPEAGRGWCRRIANDLTFATEDV